MKGWSHMLFLPCILFCCQIRTTYNPSCEKCKSVRERENKAFNSGHPKVPAKAQGLILCLDQEPQTILLMVCSCQLAGSFTFGSPLDFRYILYKLNWLHRNFLGRFNRPQGHTYIVYTRQCIEGELYGLLLLLVFLMNFNLNVYVEYHLLLPFTVPVWVHFPRQVHI